MQRIKALVFALAVTAIVPASAFAQATITGTVKDASGAVMPGVTVEATGPAPSGAAVGRHRNQRRLSDPRPPAWHLQAGLFTDRIHAGRARGDRGGRVCRLHHRRRVEGRRVIGNRHGDRRDAGRRRPEREARGHAQRRRHRDPAGHARLRLAAERHARA